MTGHSDLRRIFEVLKPHANSLMATQLDTSNLFAHLLTAAFAKTFEFNLVLKSEEQSPDPYFCTATLRGICEDIIALKFISYLSIADRQELLTNVQMVSTFDSMTKQGRFFSRYRSHQPVLPGKGNQTSAEDRLKQLKSENDVIKKKHGWQTSPFQELPSVRTMAIACNLLDIYDYIYAVTSKWVHFSPRTLVRMGWGDILDPGSSHLKEGGPLTFTTRHFAKYYYEFNSFYGSFLFLTFADQLGSELGLSPEIKRILNELRDCIDHIFRWPEDITYEEMNLPGPTFLQRLLSRPLDSE